MFSIFSPIGKLLGKLGGAQEQADSEAPTPFCAAT